MKKIIILLLALALSCSAVSCGTNNKDKDLGQTTSQTEKSNTVTVKRSPYQNIIQKYSDLLRKKENNEPLPEQDLYQNEIDSALYEIARDCSDPSTMGYATKDINKDGFEELVLLNRSCKVYAIFTLKDGAPTLLARTDILACSISPDGKIYIEKFFTNENKSHRFIQIKEIVDGALAGIEYGFNVIDETQTEHYKIENGERTVITEEEFNLFHNLTNNIISSSPYFTKSTGFRFVPALSSDVPKAAPKPDFTSYDGILSAYETIVKKISKYNQADWINGKFDAIFDISDNESYDIFHQIFYGGVQAMPTETYFGQEYAKGGNNAYGYAKKDINGDGVEELILLNDNYEIFAIFSIKGGRAVLVDGAAGAWIDENGYLRKSKGTGGIVSRDGEVFVYQLDGAKLKNKIAVGYKVNIYLQKAGWYKIDGVNKVSISDEEGKALYAEYDILPRGYCSDEYTRTFSGIEFTPLFSSTTASERHINTFTNSTYLNGTALTISTLEDTEVTASLSIVDIYGEFDPETNPEPEQYTTTLEIKAKPDENNRYHFEAEGIKGYLEFTVTAAWAVVTESENEHVSCRAYLFDYPEN